MRLKAAIAVICIVLTALAAGGCTSPLTKPSPSASPTTLHDAALENYLNALQQVEQQNYTIKAWNVSWKNDTTAELAFIAQKQTSLSNTSISTKVELIHFASPDAATEYINSLNKTGYSLSSTVYQQGGAYDKARGHAPTVFKEYQRNSDEAFFSVSVDKIAQYDDIVWISTSTLL